MAGGIDWFRWHHGCVTDEKFRLVGRIAKASVAEVIAVWARLLELASQNEDRGNIGDPDLLAIDCLLGLDDGKAEAIVNAMRARRMIDEAGKLTGWERRQPKREREDDSAERVRRRRERNASGEHVTPCNATQRQETPRGEESRGEKKEEFPPTQNAREGASPLAAQAVADPADLGEGADVPQEPRNATQEPRTGLIHLTPGIVVQNPPDGPLPEAWEPLPRQVQFCRDLGHDPDEVVAEFVAHARDKARRSADWTAAFDRWIRKEQVYAAQRRNTAPRASPAGRKPPDNVTDADFAADFAAQEARRARHAGS